MSGKHNDKISMVARACFKEGAEPRLIDAIKPSGGYTKKDFPRFMTCSTAAWRGRSPSFGTPTPATSANT